MGISKAGGIKSVLANKGAFAVLTNNGNVYTWGSHSYGGNQNGPKITTARALQATEFAFSAVLDDDTVQAWGDAKNGGNLDGFSAALRKPCGVRRSHEHWSRCHLGGPVQRWQLFLRDLGPRRGQIHRALRLRLHCGRGLKQRLERAIVNCTLGCELHVSL